VAHVRKEDGFCPVSGFCLCLFFLHLCHDFFCFGNVRERARCTYNITVGIANGLACFADINIFAVFCQQPVLYIERGLTGLIKQMLIKGFG
jgi:hypothetical protein